MYPILNGWTAESMKRTIREMNNGVCALSGHSGTMVQANSGNRCAVGCFLLAERNAAGQYLAAGRLAVGAPSDEWGMNYLMALHDAHPLLVAAGVEQRLDVRDVLCAAIDEHFSESAPREERRDDHGPAMTVIRMRRDLAVEKLAGRRLLYAGEVRWEAVEYYLELCRQNGLDPDRKPDNVDRDTVPSDIAPRPRLKPVTLGDGWPPSGMTAKDVEETFTGKSGMKCAATPIPPESMYVPSHGPGGTLAAALVGPPKGWGAAKTAVAAYLKSL